MVRNTLFFMKMTQKCTKEYVDNVNNMAVGCIQIKIKINFVIVADKNIVSTDIS